MQFAQHASDRRARERRGQRVGRPAFALMRFVEHRDVVGRQQPAAHREVEKEQRVVDDDEVGVLRLVALFERRSSRESARRTRRRNRRHRHRAAPTRRGGGTNANSARSPLSRAAGPRPRSAASSATTRTRRSRAHPLELLLAEVVAAALEQRHAQRNVERLLHERNVFAHELLLQRDRAGREHDLLPAAHRRDEIRQRFPDAGAGLDDRVHAFEDAALDELRHLHLARRALRSPAARARSDRRRAKTSARSSRSCRATVDCELAARIRFRAPRRCCASTTTGMHAPRRRVDRAASARNRRADPRRALATKSTAR